MRGGRRAITRGNVVLIHIDEVQNITDESALSPLLIALGDALAHKVMVTAPGGRRVARSLPIAVYLTGLPDFADMAGARKAAAFARRFKTITLTALGDGDISLALQPFVIEGREVSDESGGLSRITMAPDAAVATVELCRGEPFLFQLAGERAWYAGSGAVITRAQVAAGWKDAAPEAITYVERILERLPTRESEFLRAMSALPAEDRTLSKIASELGYHKTTDAGPPTQDHRRGINRAAPRFTSRNSRARQAVLVSPSRRGSLFDKRLAYGGLSR